MSKKKRNDSTKTRPARPDPVSDHWRLFIAISLPEEVRSTIAKVNGVLRDASLPLRLVEPDLAHITLHFLGNVAPERAELLTLSLPASVSSTRPFHLTTAQLGVFPNDRKPRIVWMGLGGDVEELRTVHSRLGRTLTSYQFEPEMRNLQPHITIARVRDNPPPSFAADLQTALSSQAIRDAVGKGPYEFTVTHIELVRSHLEKSGPRYETIRDFPLGAVR